jgi:hypothetical protein
MKLRAPSPPCRTPAGRAPAWARAGLALALGVVVPALPAAPPSEADLLRRYPGAELPLGERLLRQHACAECHARRAGGDGSALYRPQGRVGTPAALAAMVERCSVELNLGLFPEDVASVAAVLDRDHYRFKPADPAPRP